MNGKIRKNSFFLRKLYNIVNDPFTDDIISWSIKGNSFIIKDFHYFCTEILPKNFNTKLFSSFNRQLNFYNFSKINNFQYEFANEYFIQGRVELLNKISRKSNFSKHSVMVQLQSKILTLTQESHFLYKRIEKLKVKEELLQNAYNELLNKNLLLQNQLYYVSTKEKETKAMLFAIMEHLSPVFRYVEFFFSYALKNDSSTCKWLKETTSQIIHNAIKNYILSSSCEVNNNNSTDNSSYIIDTD